MIWSCMLCISHREQSDELIAINLLPLGVVWFELFFSPRSHVFLIIVIHPAIFVSCSASFWHTCSLFGVIWSAPNYPILDSVCLLNLRLNRAVNGIIFSDNPVTYAVGCDYRMHGREILSSISVFSFFKKKLLLF